MANPFGAPGIDVQTLANKQASGEAFIWLDVREPMEYARVSIDDDRIVYLPLSQLAAQQLNALPDAVNVKDAPIVVMCHHGNRSAQVTLWLRQQGWTDVVNMDGGIDAWARQIDPTVGTY